MLVLTIGSFYVDASSNFNKTIHFDADDRVLGALMQNITFLKFTIRYNLQMNWFE